MLYDAFISHATEDKDSFVRPLAECLRRKRVEVWYDEFTLMPGKSLRKSIDQGLAKSRYGIVILSPHFLGKSWPEWELNGLVQRHISGSQNVILPIWLEIGKEEISAYSPPLADILAIRSDVGVEEVARQLLRVIQPEESALVFARNLVVSKGYEPPVITDDWWLDAIESSGWQHEYRWCFPVWRMSTKSAGRGEQLGWLVMQHVWQEEAEADAISQITPPEEALQFIRSQPGLIDVCHQMPDLLLEFAPQLAIPGFAAELESTIDAAYQVTVRKAMTNRARKSTNGSGISTNGLSPACEECFALRHPTFGDYQAGIIANHFVCGGGGGLGPTTRAFPVIEYLLWFLSSRSDWLPRKHHAFLLRGMKEWAVWLWNEYESDSEYKGANAGALQSLLFEFENKKGFRLTKDARADLTDRIAHARLLLSLPENVDLLTNRFLNQGFIEAWFARRSDIRRRQRMSGPKK
jgi:hypothetical protein